MKNKFNDCIKGIILLCFCTTTSFVSAQYIKPDFGNKDLSPHGSLEVSWYNIYWFYEGNVGARLLGSTSNQASLSTGLNLNAGAGYYFSEKFGLKGRIDYHRFSFSPGLTGGPKASGGAMSFSAEGLTNLLYLINPRKFSKWRLALHGGLGYTSFNNRSFKEDALASDPNYFDDDPAIKGNDDMGHIILGLTPQYHINGRCSINLDLSTFLLIKQDFTFDNYNGVRHEGLGNISTISLGFTFRP